MLWIAAKGRDQQLRAVVSSPFRDRQSIREDSQVSRGVEVLQHPVEHPSVVDRRVVLSVVGLTYRHSVHSVGAGAFFAARRATFVQSAREVLCLHPRQRLHLHLQLRARGPRQRLISLGDHQDSGSRRVRSRVRVGGCMPPRPRAPQQHRRS